MPLKPAQAVDITGGVTTAVVYQGIMGELNATMQQAFSQGNYLVWNAAAQARVTIDRWGETNKELMDKAFSELSAQQQQLFRGTNDLVQELDAKVDKLTDKANRIADQVQQIVSDVKFWDGTPALLRYGPTVLNAERKTKKIMTVRGISLNRSDPLLFLTIDGNRVRLPRTSLTQQEASFEIPATLLVPDINSTKIITGEMQITHTKPKYLGIFGSETIKTTSEVNVLLLPKFIGELTSLETFKTGDKRIYTDWKSREFHFSSGSIDEKCDVQVQAPVLDHKIDPDTIQIWENRPNPHPLAGKNLGFIRMPATLPGVWGKAGNQRIESKSTEGFAVRVCAKRWACCFPPDTGPGFQHVVYRWREFKTIKDTEKTAHPGAKIAWNQDTLLRVSPNSDGLIATISLFSGEQRVEIREKLDGKYYTVEFEPKTGAILIRPKVPAEMASIIN